VPDAEGRMPNPCARERVARPPKVSCFQHFRLGTCYFPLAAA